MKKPTFLLKPSAYKSNKLYAIIPSDGTGDLSVSSYVGNGTRVNKDGFIEAVPTDTPRLDYLDTPGLLLEPSRRNFILYSNTLQGNTFANLTNIVANDTISPDGTKNAYLVVDQSSVQVGYTHQTITVLDATTIHSVSVFMKFLDTTKSSMYVSSRPTTSKEAYIDCHRDGTVEIGVDTNSIITSVSSKYYGNGWWRFMAVVDMDNTDTQIQLGVFPANYGAVADVDLMGSLWTWGFQIEQGQFPTSFIPTGATQLVRAYDSITLTGIEPLDIITSLATGVVLVEAIFNLQKADATDNVFTLGTTDGQIGINKLDTSTESYPRVRVLSTDTTADVYTTTQKRNKIAFSMSGDNVDVFINGSSVLSTGKDFFLTADDLNFNGQGSSWKLLSASIYKETMTSTELQALTK